MLRVFASWRLAAVLLMGFSSGLPLALTGTTLQAWMASEKIDLTVIGFFTAVTLPYTLKFLWSPLMDRFLPPFLGRRRGWILISQVALVGGLIGMAVSSVSASPWGMAALAMLVAFFGASQDIVIDAYRTEVLRGDELGPGAGLSIMGYRVGMICSGALALILADRMPWQSVYLLMAAGMSVGIVTAFLAPEPPVDARPPRTLTQAAVLPLKEFLLRRGAVEMLLFIFLYKLDAFMVGNMMTPFMLGAGFSMTDIGVVTKGVGIAAAIAGAAIGGAFITRLGIHRSLWIFGLLQGLAGLSFTALALLGHNYPMMVTAIVAENVCSGMAIAAFTGFLMSLCDKRFTATQYALLTSLMALGARVVGTPSGWLVKQVGWPAYFVIATLIAIPGLLLLLRYKTWQREPVQETAGASA